MARRSNPNDIKGLSESESFDKKRYLTDDRRLGEHVHTLLIGSDVSFVYFSVCAVSAFLLPGPWEIYTLLTFLYGRAILSYRRKYPVVPLLLPYTAPVPYDKRLPKPGTGRKKFGRPSGNVFLGMCRETGRQVWLRFQDFLRHTLIFGGTGSGKSEMVLSIAYSFIAAGGGLLHSDAKADNKTPHKYAWFAKRYGREDDLFFMNFNKPVVDDPFELPYSVTHSSNPTTDGGENEIANMAVSLMPDMKGGGSNQSFADNAILLVRSLASTLVDLRNNGHIELSWGTFRDHVQLNKCLELARNENLSPIARNKMRRFISNVAGVNMNNEPDDQSDMALRQFGFISSYTLNGLAQMTDNYAYVYGAKYGDVSQRDNILSNRICLSFIPSMKNTPDEIKMLGKISLNGQRFAMAEGLPSKIEGTAREALHEELYKEGVVPSLMIADEYQMLRVEGNSVVVQQARSLGFGVIFSLQNESGLGGKDDDERHSVLENTDIKMLGRNQGVDTFKVISDSIGETMISQSEGVSYERSNLMGQKKKHGSSYNQRSIMDIKDIASQIEGEFHMTYGGRLIRIEGPYIQSPYDAKSWDYPEQSAVIFSVMVPIEPVSIEEIIAHETGSDQYDAIISGKKVVDAKATEDCKVFANLLGFKSVPMATVIESIMLDIKIGASNDDYLETKREPVVTVDNPDTAPTAQEMVEEQITKVKTKKAVSDIQAIMAKKAAQKAEESKTEEIKQHSLFDNTTSLTDEDAHIPAHGSDDGLLILQDELDDIQILAGRAVMDAARAAGLRNNEVDPAMLDEVRRIINNRPSLASIEERDKRIDAAFNRLGID